MTATINRRGQIVLRRSAGEKVTVKAGDVLVVIRDQDGRIILEKRATAGTDKRRSYLNPPPLPRRVLTRVYQQTDRQWNKVEGEAVALSQRALAGRRLEEL